MKQTSDRRIEVSQLLPVDPIDALPIEWPVRAGNSEVRKEVHAGVRASILLLPWPHSASGDIEIISPRNLTPFSPAPCERLD